MTRSGRFVPDLVKLELQRLTLLRREPGLELLPLVGSEGITVSCTAAQTVTVP